MKPARFAYHDPETLDAALSLLAQLGDEATVLAGGQSLIPLLNLRLATPDALVDIRKVGLTGIEVRPGAVHLGAMARAADVEADPEVRRSAPSLVGALRHVGHPQIRNRTTIGGNIAHADPASELPAVLLGLDGTVTLASAARGARTIPASEFFLGGFWTDRQPDELVTGVTFPLYGGPAVFLEVARRPGDFAVAGAFVGLTTADGVVVDARIALSGVADGAVRSRGAERVLVGSVPDVELIGEVARTATADLDPISDGHGSGEYRRAMARVLVARGLRAMAEAA